MKYIHEESGKSWDCRKNGGRFFVFSARNPTTVSGQSIPGLKGLIDVDYW